MRKLKNIEIGLIAGLINFAVIILIMLSEPFTKSIIYWQTHYEFGNHQNTFAFNGRLTWIILTILTVFTALLLIKSLTKKKKIRPTILLTFVLMCYMLNISLAYIYGDLYLEFKSNSIGQFEYSLINIIAYSTLITILFGFILSLTIRNNEKK